MLRSQPHVPDCTIVSCALSLPSSSLVPQDWDTNGAHAGSRTAHEAAASEGAESGAEHVERLLPSSRSSPLSALRVRCDVGAPLQVAAPRSRTEQVEEVRGQHEVRERSGEQSER